MPRVRIYQVPEIKVRMFHINARKWKLRFPIPPPPAVPIPPFKLFAPRSSRPLSLSLPCSILDSLVSPVHPMTIHLPCDALRFLIGIYSASWFLIVVRVLWIGNREIVWITYYPCIIWFSNAFIIYLVSANAPERNKEIRRWCQSTEYGNCFVCKSKRYDEYVRQKILQFVSLNYSRFKQQIYFHRMKQNFRNLLGIN